MNRCARCEAEIGVARENAYCEECSQRFEAVRERGVGVRYRTDIAGGVLPSGFYKEK